MHILKFIRKLPKKLNLPKPLKYDLSHYTLRSNSNPQVHSSLKYADVLWDGFSESDTFFFLQSLHIEGIRVATGALKGYLY